MKKLLDRIPARLRNRYTATALGLLCWIAFFDQNDAWTTFKNRRELARMQEQKEFYVTEIARTKEHLHELGSDKALLEKFARERYLMKRDNEDIFVLVPEKKD
ncbi:MAG: septum formation initiator family protein [Flavobacteriales bacterium]|nr:septum formation initiator family protein [Flavobacteriales bacterium]